MLFLADKIKEESDGNGNHNEDSSSTDPIASSSTHGLNNGNDIELVLDGSAGRGHSKLIAFAGSAANRPQLMDTSELEGVTHGALVQNISTLTTPGSIVNHHLNSHQHEENVILINSSDGNTTALNGGTLLAHHNGAGCKFSFVKCVFKVFTNKLYVVNILNSRILSTSIAQRAGNLPGTSIATMASVNSPLTSTHSLIYASHPATLATPVSLNRLKSESSVNDLHRHLTSPPGHQIIPVPLHLSQLQGTGVTALAPGVSIGFYNHNLAGTSFASPQQVATALGGVKSSGAAISTASSSCRSQLSPVPLQSTPIPASRKNPLYLLTSKDHSPVTSSSTPLSLDNTSSLEHSVSVSGAAPLSTYVLSSAGLVNAASISAASNSSSILHQAASQFTNSSVSPGKTTTTGKLPVEGTELIKQVVLETIGELEDEEMSFCRSLAASLRYLDRSQKEVAKLELQQVIVRHTNPNYGKCTAFLSGTEEGRHVGSCTLRSNSNGDHNGNGGSTNTVSTITKSGTNSEKTASCEKSTNNKLQDNGQTMIGEGGDPNGHHHHSNKS